MTKSSGSSRRKRWIAVLRLLVGGAIFATILRYLLPSWGELTAQVQLDPVFLGVGLLGAGLAHVAVAARWKLLSESMGGTPLSFWAYLHSLLVTRFLGQFVSSLAMDLVGRGVALRAAGSQRGIGHATTLVVLERIFDLVLPVLLLLWALAVRQFGLESYAALLLLGGTVLFVVVATPGLRPLARLALAVYGRLRRKDVGELPDEITVPISFQVATLSVFRFASVLLQFIGIGAGIGLLLPWPDWAAATPIAQLTGMVGVTPGGLGVVEAGWWAGLAWVGVEEHRIGLFLLAQRTALIAFLGSLALLSWPPARAALRRVRQAESAHPESANADPANPEPASHA